MVEVGERGTARKPVFDEIIGELWLAKQLWLLLARGGSARLLPLANLGTTLAKKKYSVVMIDTDIGLRNLDVVMGLENRIVYNLVDIIEGKCRKERGYDPGQRKIPNLFMIPSSTNREKNSITPEQMKELCSTLAAEFDYVLIDCPQGIDRSKTQSPGRKPPSL